MACRSRGPVVGPEQAAKALAARNSIDWLRLCLAVDQPVAQALVVAFEVVVRRVLLDGTAQMTLTDRHDLREAFLFDRPHEALGVCVEVRAGERKPDRLDPGRTEERGTAAAEG